jgi:hypothetical protein
MAPHGAGYSGLPAFLWAAGTVILRSFLVGFGLFLMLPAPASAAITQKDILAAARALTFLEHPPKGRVEIGVVVDPADSGSVKDADIVKSTIGNGLVIGDLTIHARMLTRTELSGLQGIGAFLVTGTSPDIFRDVAGVAKSLKILTVSTEPACAQEGYCVMLVRSDPKVQIFVNPRVAEQNDIAFTQTFSLMIKELP